jgi:hypothetical protein
MGEHVFSCRHRHNYRYRSGLHARQEPAELVVDELQLCHVMRIRFEFRCLTCVCP